MNYPSSYFYYLTFNILNYKIVEDKMALNLEENMDKFV